MGAVAEVNERAVIGGNNPPEAMTAFEAVKINITDLYEEASQWLDGEPVETQEQANAINTLKASIKLAKKAADDQYDIEMAPLDERVKEIRARYNLLTGDNKSVKGLTVKAEQACNAALRPFLLKLEAKQQEEARVAREEADRIQREAQDAMRQRDAANLIQSEAAERLVTEAKAADAAARKAETAKAHAKGEGRATGLRTVPRAVMVNQRDAAAWVWAERNAELMEFVQQQADKAVRAGSRTIKGFDVIEEKVL